MLTQYSITADDFVQAQRVNTRSKRAGARVSYLLFRILPPIAFLVVLLVSIVRPEQFPTLMPGLIFTGILTAIIFAQPFLWRRQFAKIPPAQMQVAAEFSEMEIHLKTANTDSAIQWQHFLGWAEGKDLFLLHQRATCSTSSPSAPSRLINSKSSANFSPESSRRKSSGPFRMPRSGWEC